MHSDCMCDMPSHGLPHLRASHQFVQCLIEYSCVQFVEYQEQYDESNSDVPDGGSDSDYNSIDSGGESDDKDLKAAELREMRTQQRAKVWPSTGASKSSGGVRRQKRAPKGAPKESEFDEEEVGELEDLIVRPVANLAKVLPSFAPMYQSRLALSCTPECSHYMLCTGQRFRHCRLAVRGAGSSLLCMKWMASLM